MLRVLPEGSYQAEASRLQALPEVAGIVREFGGEEDVGLGKTPVGDAKYGYAGARRRFGEEPSCGGDVLLEFLLLVRGFDGYRAREVKGYDKIEAFGGEDVRGCKERETENDDRDFYDGAAGKAVGEGAIEVAPKFVLKHRSLVIEPPPFFQFGDHFPLDLFGGLLDWAGVVAGDGAKPPRFVQRQARTYFQRERKEGHEEAHQA